MGGNRTGGRAGSASPATRGKAGEAGSGARFAFPAFLAAYLAYGAAFIARTSFVFGGTRRFVLFDDAMISMRFARNLAHGHGLVWNAGGPHVEGFTNLLWVIVMAVMHLLPVGETRTALAVQVASLAALAVNLVMVRRLAADLAGAPGSAAPAVGVWFALVLTAFYLPLNNWALQGMEVGALALILTSALLLAYRGAELPGRVASTAADETSSVAARRTADRNPAARAVPVAPYLLLGIGTLVRLDMVLPLLTIGGYLALTDAPERRRRHIALALGTAVVFVGAQTLFRLAYYGQALPNTYYLKLSGYPIGARIARGLRVFLDFVWRFNPILFLAPYALLIARGRSGRSLLGPGLLATVFTVQCLYSIWVGGDAWEHWGGANRFICIAMPAFFILIGIAASDVHTWARGRGWNRAGAAIWVVLVLAVLQVNLLRGAPTPKGMLLIDRPVESYGNSWATIDGLAIRAITADDASVAVVWAGSIPYVSQRPAIDLLGRCDPKIAREPAHPGEFYPGHMKWDYAYSIGGLKPDVIAQLWDLKDPLAYTTLEAVPPDARAYVEGDYVVADVGGYRMLLRKDSRKILWDKARPYLKELEK